jgi:NTP pyrophosphatase (non-canonical NTP hydrolase)
VTGNEYQQAAMRTKGVYADLEDQIIYASMGLAGESGEVSEMIKKVVWHGHEMDYDRLLDELGDVLWYVALAADAVGLSVNAVMEHNIVKLRGRYPDGFSQERSKYRDDQ